MAYLTLVNSLRPVFKTFSSFPVQQLNNANAPSRLKTLLMVAETKIKSVVFHFFNNNIRPHSQTEENI
jgi:hypothetical protein